MNLTFSICDIGDKNIRILDTTQDGDEYVPEDLDENKYNIVRYFNYKYTETCTINILQYNATSKVSIASTKFTDHNSFLDEAVMRIDKDGYYTLYHMVIPTIDWLEDRLTNEEYDMGVYEGIYVTDCVNIYKVVDQQLLPCSYEELMTTPTENTTISRCVRDLFYYHDLYYCYINLCNQVFNKYILSCPEKSSDNNIYRYNRDLLWSTINVLRFYVENGDYESAQLLIEKLDSCNGICKQQVKNESMSECGCS